MIDISGLDKAELLAALVNAAEPLGMGKLSAGKGQFTADEAKEWIANGQWHDSEYSRDIKREWLYFDYVRGRPIKCDLSGDTLDPRLYDRDQGAGAAARVVASLRGQ